MEKVEKNKKVSISYSLKDENGAIVEEIPENFPFVYMHGCASIIEGLEEALEGHKIGDHVTAHIPCDKGYGPYRKDLIIKVPKKELRNLSELWIGMELEMVPTSKEAAFSVPEDPRDIYSQSLDEDGIYILREIQKDTVTLDGNHPFAGKDLTYEVTIVDITDASATELETGYPDEDFEDEDEDDDDFDEDGFDEDDDFPQGDFPNDGQNNFGRHWR
jgi:FKBP-type peptidyl-prolyl cis-trans isomerase SlyD